ncbi:MAG: hypothetical protein ACJ74W_05015 [Pyrinomonadaceae bacterium]
MEAVATPYAPADRRGYRGILLGGLVAGVFDITYACVALGLRGRSPVWVLQSVATGWLGASAFQGGLPAAALGLVSHFMIAFGAAAVYYAASRKLRFMVRQAVLCGLLYGVGLFLFMNWVVIPLSAAPFKIPFMFAVLWKGFLSHGLLIGLPIALAVRRDDK